MAVSCVISVLPIPKRTAKELGKWFEQTKYYVIFEQFVMEHSIGQQPFPMCELSRKLPSTWMPAPNMMAMLFWQPKAEKFRDAIGMRLHLYFHRTVATSLIRHKDTNGSVKCAALV